MKSFKTGVVLGLNCVTAFYGSAAIVIGGKIVAAAEEERLNRIKNTPAFPRLSVEYCLKQAGLTMKDVDSVAVCGDPARYVFEFLLPQAIRQPHSNMFDRNMRLATRYFNSERTIRDTLDYYGPIHFYLHHMCHWASSYYPSGFNESAMLSVDGFGETQSVAAGTASPDGLKLIYDVHFPHSLGVLYYGITHWCGFHYQDVGKAMGLASYGKHSEFVDLFDKMVRLKDDGGFELDLNSVTFHYERDSWFRGEFLEAIGKPRARGADLTQKDMNLAYAMQKVFEKTVVHMANHLHDQTKLHDLCMVGGCAYNCLTNGLILEKTPFKRLFIQPAAGDPGTSLGAALLEYFTRYESYNGHIGAVDMNHSYLGPGFSAEEIVATLNKHRLHYCYDPAPWNSAAQSIYEGKIVGWFQGRLEYGPRALGNRSILSAPYPAEMKDRVNKDVKHREPFRPFAPATIDEKYADYFSPCGDPRYMLCATVVKEEVRKKIPAVVHVDQTARIQSVNAQTNERFHKLIRRFGELSGIYVVLNTSFNDNNMPIVNSPEDAIQCFKETNLHELYIGDFKVARS